MSNTHIKVSRKSLFVVSLLFLAFSVYAFSNIYYPLYNNTNDEYYTAGLIFINLLYVISTFIVVVLINFIGHKGSINSIKATNSALTICMSIIGSAVAFALLLNGLKLYTPNIISIFLLVFALLVVYVLKNLLLKHKLYNCNLIAGLLKDVVIFLMVFGLTYFLVLNMRDASKHVILTARVPEFSLFVVYVRFIIYVFGVSLLAVVAYTNSFKVESKNVYIAFYVLLGLFSAFVLLYLVTMMNYDKKLRNGEQITTLFVLLLFYVSSTLLLVKSNFKYQESLSNTYDYESEDIK